MTAARFEAVDRELAEFGKSEQELVLVAQRARELRGALDDVDAELAGLGEGLDQARIEAAGAAKAWARSAVQAPAVQAPAVQAPAMRAPASVPTSRDDGDIPSGLLEIPEEELRDAELPPVLDLNEHDRISQPPASFPNEHTDLVSADGLHEGADATHDAPVRMSDIAGLSVDELFADAEASPPAATGGLADLFDDEEEVEDSSALAGGLADLFDDEDPLRASDPDLASLESLEASSQIPLEASDLDAASDLEAGAPEPMGAEPHLGGLFGENDEESTGVVPAAEIHAMEEGAEPAHDVPIPFEDIEELGSGEFELLVDEDVLAFDDEDAE